MGDETNVRRPRRRWPGALAVAPAPAAPAPPPPLYTLREAAAYLHISEGTLRNWVMWRRLTYVKVGSKTHFRLADLDAYITAHCVEAIHT
jgi:excisionase family DNA binding protein